MTRRERTIIVATVAVVLYGGYQFLAPKAKKADPGRRTAVSENLTPFAAEVVGRMRKLDSTEKDAYVVARGNSPWPANPFFQGKIQAEEEKKGVAMAETVAEKLVLSGFLQFGERTFAVINGAEYEAGETLMGFGLTIVSISPNQVILRENGTSDNIVLKLAGADE